ncbi:myo-inositol 2-dehydrogenase [Abditibacteriota bacterium]|nr:myo-inositol 2-dehydrogenase [Abditibacteriota bacterium]
MKFNIAVIGCGGVSSMHFEGFARHTDRVNVVAVCDPDAERRAQAQQKYGIAQGFSTVEELLAGADFVAAVVCTPTNVREPVVATLAAAGKHILVEKPFASSLEEGQRMVGLCERNGVFLAVDQNFRYHFPFHIAKDHIAAGLVGKVTAIHLQHMHFRQDSGWRTREKRHTLEIMGVHWLDGFRWILDSDGQNLSAQMRHSNTIDCVGETDLSVQVAFANGTFATYIDSFSSLIPRCEALIIGESGTLRLDYDGASLFDQSGAPQPSQKWANPFAGNGKPDSAFECLNQLLLAIESGEQPSNGGRDNLKTLTLMEAAYLSSESGTTVKLTEGRL